MYGAPKPPPITGYLVNNICTRVAQGESLVKICNESGMPSVAAFYSHLKKDAESYRLFDAAREANAEARAEKLMDEILFIADTHAMGQKVVDGPKGTTITHEDQIEHRRLQVLSRKWMIEKLAPHRYGVRTQVDHKSSDGSMSPSDMSEDSRMARLAAIMKQAARKMETDWNDLV